MVVQRNSELLGGMRDLISVDGRGKGFVFPLLFYRFQFHVCQPF